MTGSRAAALLLSSTRFQLATWNDEDDVAVPRVQLQPAIALLGDRAALGKVAYQLFAQDDVDLVTNVLGRMADTHAPGGAASDAQADLWCAALLRQLCQDAGAAPRDPCVVVLPDKLIDLGERVRRAAQAAGVAVLRCMPASLAAAHATQQDFSGGRLVCTFDETAASIALVRGDATGLKVVDWCIVAGVGRGGIAAVAVGIVVDALRADGQAISHRRLMRIRLAVQPLLASLARGETVPLNIEIRTRVRRIWISPGEISRRSHAAGKAFADSARHLARSLAGPVPVLLAGEREELAWAKCVLSRAILGVSFEELAANATATGAIRAVRSDRSPLVLTDVAELDLVGLLEVQGRSTRFDVLFDPRDPRERSPRRVLSFPKEARIALFRPTEDGFERVGEVHFPQFDYEDKGFDVWFSRAGNGVYAIQCHESASGKSEIKHLVPASSQGDRTFASALARLRILAPLAPGTFY